MWEWDVKTGKMYIGDSIEEVFGYVLKNNEISYSDFTRWLLPQEKMAVEKRISKVLDSRKNTWKDAFLLKRSDGSIAATTSRASIVRNEKGKAIRMIGTIQDISRIQELEILLSEQTALREEQSEKFLTASRLSFDVIWDWNLVTNEVFRGEGYEELFGYSMILNKGNIADWGNYIHPDDRVGVEKRLTKAISSSTAYWEDDYRFIRADGSIAKIFDRASIFRDTSGKAYRMIGSMHDISKQKVLEERLEQEIKLKEKQIAEATQEEKESARSDIGKELHDNVNQLLGASNMYLEMAKRGGSDTELYLSRSSEYTHNAIAEIRKLTRGLTTDFIRNLGLRESIQNLVEDIMEINPVKISCSMKSFIEPDVTDKFKLNVFRIVQEQLNNILKHAKATKAGVTLSQNKKFIILSISDNGVGFDTGKKQTGIGIANIKNRAEAYNGKADFNSQPGKGCILTVTFAMTRILLK